MSCDAGQLYRALGNRLAELAESSSAGLLMKASGLY
jgi:hypothetical protein